MLEFGIREVLYAKCYAVKLMALMEKTSAMVLQLLTDSVAQTLGYPTAEISATHSSPSSVEGVETTAGQELVNSLKIQLLILQQ